MNKRGLNPNSRANLKKTAGPGRPKMTPEQRAMKEYLADYLENGEAIKDFERARRTNPLKALEIAMDTVYGRPKQAVELVGGPLIVRVNNPLAAEMQIEESKEEDERPQDQFKA